MKKLLLIPLLFISFVAFGGILFLTPLKNVSGLVTNGLVLQLEASRANGTSFPGTGTATDWVDLSGAGLWSSPTINNTPQWIGDGSTGNPYALQITSHATASVVGNTNFGIDAADSRTLCIWVKTPSGEANDPGPQAGFGDTANNGHLFLLSESTGSTHFYSLWGYGEDVRSSTASADDAWYFHCATYDGSTITAYLNDTSYGTRSAVLSTDNVNFTLGSIASGFLSGAPIIAEVYVYTRALSGAEITQNCNYHKAYFGGATCN